MARKHHVLMGNLGLVAVAGKPLPVYDGKITLSVCPKRIHILVNIVCLYGQKQNPKQVLSSNYTANS